MSKSWVVGAVGGDPNGGVVAQTFFSAVSPTFVSAGPYPVPTLPDWPTVWQVQKPVLHPVFAGMPVNFTALFLTHA